MRIMHTVGGLLLPRDPDTQGASGAVQAALGIARAQVQRGHEVWVVAVGHTAWQVVWHGVRLTQVKLAPWAQVQVGRQHLDFRAQLPLIILTHRYHFDVVQGYLHHYLRFLRAPCRAVHFQIDPFYSGMGTPDPSMKASDFAVIARHTHVQLAASRFVGAQVRQGLGDQGQIYVVYNGVDGAHYDSDCRQEERRRLRDAWGVRDDEIVFLYAGAIVPEKGVLHLARAFLQLSAQLPDIRLVLAGDAGLWDQQVEPADTPRAYQREVRATLDAARQCGKVRFLGKLGASAMPSIYAASDVVVVPSVWQEAFGLVAVEALAAGRPVIASATGGLPELVNDTNGLLVEPGNEAALVAAMHALASDEPLRRRLGQAGREQALRFSWDEAARMLDSIYASQLRLRGWR